MKSFLDNVKGWIINHKKQSWIILIVILFLILGSVYFLGHEEEVVTLKKEVFEIEVHEEVSKDASEYLDGIKDVDEVEFDFSKVDYQTLGEYEGKLIYKDKEYILKFKIVDTTAPVITMDQTDFVFPLDTAVVDVNEEVNTKIKITDNYDKEFEPIEVVTEIPENETELEVAVSIKDTSDNESETVVIKIQFTEDGEEKENLQTEGKTVSKSSGKQPSSNTTTNNGSSSNAGSPSSDSGTSSSNGGSSSSNNGAGSSNGGSSSSNGNNSSGESPSNGAGTEKPAPTPDPTPTPTPKPDPEPTYVCPTGVIDKMKPCDYYEFTPSPLAIEYKIFKSDAEINAYYIDLDDNKYKIMRGSVRVNDGTFLYSAQIIAR